MQRDSLWSLESYRPTSPRLVLHGRSQAGFRSLYVGCIAGKSYDFGNVGIPHDLWEVGWDRALILPERRCQH